MGGYLHLAHVIAADLDRLGQLRPGEPVRFRRVELSEARAIDRADREAPSPVASPDRGRRRAGLIPIEAADNPLVR